MSVNIPTLPQQQNHFDLHTLLALKDNLAKPRLPDSEYCFLSTRNRSLANYNSPHREMSVWRPAVLVSRGYGAIDAVTLMK